MLGSSWGATAAAAAAAGLAAAALVGLHPCCTPVACSPIALGSKGLSLPACFLTPHELHVCDSNPSLNSRCLRWGDTVGSEASHLPRGGWGPPCSSRQGAPLPDEEEVGTHSLKDLGSNKWMAQKLHEYVQAKEAEKRRAFPPVGLWHLMRVSLLSTAASQRAYLLPRRKRLPLANFSEDALVFGKVGLFLTLSLVVSVLPFGCRVDVGCVDTLGLLHVRDMHFLPRALQAGAEYLKKAEALEAEPAKGDSLLPGASSCKATNGWIAHAGDVLKVGDALYLKIKSIDRDNRRMRLTTACTPETSDGDTPRKAIGTFWAGQEVEGIVLRATSFGLFLDIGAVEDAFLHVNELWRRDDSENVPQLYDKFRSSSRRRQRAGASSHVSGNASEADDPRDPTQFSTGDRMTGLRVLEVDAARNRIQLTTRSEAEVQRLLRWRQMALGLPRDAHQQDEESEEEKVAKMRAALKLLERHRKKQQLLGSDNQLSTVQQQQQQQQHLTQEDLEDNKYARLFPGYTHADFDEALSLLEAEKRRKELLFLQEAERKARRRHPRFIRQSADDLSVQEAWQLLREEEPGVVTPEMLREDARRHAVSAGLNTAELPVFGPDGLPQMQQVPLKDLMPEAGDRQPSTAAARHTRQPTAAKEDEHLSAPAGDTQQFAAAGDSEKEAASRVSSVTADSKNVDPTGEEDAREDIDVSPETIQQELAAYNDEGNQFQRIADIERSSQASEETEGYQLQHSSRAETPRPGQAEAAKAEPSSEEIEAFFAKSQKALLASLRKGRTRRDRAILAAEEQEIQDLIQQDRDRVLKAVARGGSGSLGETAEAETAEAEIERQLREGSRLTETRDEEEETEETLGEVSHSEVLKTIRDRLRADPRMASEVRRQGTSPEALATRVQSLLQQVTSTLLQLCCRSSSSRSSTKVTPILSYCAAVSVSNLACCLVPAVPSVASSVLGLRDELAALLTADAAGDSKRQARSSGRRKPAWGGSLSDAGPLEETGDESEEGFVSPFFQLSDEGEKGDLGLNDSSRDQGVDLGSSAELETDKLDAADDEDITSYLQTAPSRPRSQARTPRIRTGSASRRSRASAAAEAAASSSEDSSVSRLKPQPPAVAEDAAAGKAAVTPRSWTTESSPMETASARPDAAGQWPSRLEEGDSSLRPIDLDSIKAAVSRARRGAAAAAAGVKTATQQQQIRGHRAALTSSAGKRETVAPLQASSLTSQVSPGIQPPAAHPEETEPPRKAAGTQKASRSSKPAIVLLPEQLHAPQGLSPATRPVRSLADFRELQRQQSLLRQQQLSPGKGSARASSSGRSPPSQHRQIQQTVRRLHEQRGGT
ncbi:hypothetical protein Emed_002449 [Eimeria media]